MNRIAVNRGFTLIELMVTVSWLPFSWYWPSRPCKRC
ncbi:MAG: prepilin-type N-terminal cleavage/methylation domain-containing protein [Comamonadaceae bacterium]|nr:prepilin-type N-terminal cleavage/methylation domain-containing protein [Comamonadaceae bacterium]